MTEKLHLDKINGHYEGFYYTENGKLIFTFSSIQEAKMFCRKKRLTLVIIGSLLTSRRGVYNGT